MFVWVLVGCVRVFDMRACAINRMKMDGYEVDEKRSANNVIRCFSADGEERVLIRVKVER